MEINKGGCLCSPFLQKNGEHIHLIVDNQPFTMLGGELHNSSASSPEILRPLWPQLRKQGLNTVLVPVSWELVEPQEGVFDFSLVKELIEGAYQHELRLVLLWFGTWKNASSTYVPAWVKQDRIRFFRVVDHNGQTNQAISPFCIQARDSDARAFSCLMEFLRENDEHQTVLAVQVENEPGFLGTARDYSPQAEKMYRQPIPKTLSLYLEDNRNALSSWLHQYWDSNRKEGAWQDVFGTAAPEIFSAYTIATYINFIAEQGKRKYALPLLANAWTVQCENEPAGKFPSGGPVARVHDIWRHAAPSIDILAPDLYLENFKDECQEYTRLADNPLFIPEMRRDKWAMAHVFYAVGEHRAICVSPFGIDSLIQTQHAVLDDANVQEVVKTLNTSFSLSLSAAYSVLENLLPLLHDSDLAAQGILQDHLPYHYLALNNTAMQIVFNSTLYDATEPAGGLVVEVGEGELILAGAGFTAVLHTEIIEIEEGKYHNGQWMCYRRLNGDERNLRMPEVPSIRRVRYLVR